MYKNRSVIIFLILYLILGTFTFATGIVCAANRDLSSNSLYISELRLGDSGEKPNQEYVRITNGGTTPVNMMGWQIKDEDEKHTYTFPDYTLYAKNTITLRSGKGTNDGNTLYWNKWSFIWNNIDPRFNQNGDIAYLYNAQKILVSTKEVKG